MLSTKLKQIIDQPKQAALLTAVLSPVPFLHWFAVLFMLTVTLRKGLQFGLMLAVIVSVISGLVFGLSLHVYGMALIFQIINPLALCLLACCLRQKASWLLVLQIVTALGILIVVGIYVCVPELAQVWSLALIEIVKQKIVEQPELLAALNANGPLLYQMLGSLAVGLRVMLFMALGLASLLMARYIQATLYNPGGLKPELYAWRLNLSTGIALIALVILALVIKTPVFLSMLPVLMVPFICTGLTLVHVITARTKYQWIILLVFYLAMITVLPQLLLLVIALGVLDSLINFRKRFNF